MELLQKYPFFGHLAMHMKLKETPEIPTAGVTRDGELWYNPKFIDSLTFDELVGVIAHEVLHLALLHPFRIGKRNSVKWNLATDSVVNYVLVKNDLKLPKGAIIPTKYGDVTIQGMEINVSNKSAEEVYSKIPDLPQTYVYAFDIHTTWEIGSGNKKGKGGSDGKDEKEGEGKGAKELKEKLEEAGQDIEEKMKEWMEKITEAMILAKRQGKLPVGMERLIEKILRPKLNWRALLWKYITQELPLDYTWAKPHKKSYSVGVYLPHIVKESMDVVVAIDTSGSISQQELEEFISETIAIAKSFRNVKMTVITCDAEVQDVYSLTNGNIDKLKHMEIHGYGGTDFRPVFNYIKRKIPNARILVYLTDGYGEFPKQETVRTIWVLTKEGIPEKEIPFGRVIRIE